MITFDESCEAFRQYALAGAKYYRDSFSSTEKRLVGHKLANQFEVKDPVIEAWFRTLRAGGTVKPLLFPTPKPAADMRGAFFTVARHPNAAAEALAVTLVFWLDEGRNQTIAFRMEPADQVSWAHAYAHVQITRTLREPVVQTTLPSWIPDSFPGFPTGCRAPSDYFYSTLAAVHGYGGPAQSAFAHKIIRDSFSNEAQLARKVVSGMEAFFS